MSTNTDKSTKFDLSNLPPKFTSKWKAVCRAKLPGCQQEKIKIDDVDNFSSTSWVTIIETDEDVCRKRRLHVSTSGNRVFLYLPLFRRLFSTICLGGQKSE